MIQLLTDVVLIVTGFQLLVLAVVVLTRNPRGDIRSNLLALFLLTKALLVSRWFAYRFDLLDYRTTMWFSLVIAAGFFVLAPVLYLHVKALCSGGSRLGKAALVHFLPAAGAAMAGAVCSAPPTEGGTGVLAWAAGVSVQNYWRFFWAVNFAQILVYIIAMFRIVRQRRGCYTPIRTGRPKPGFRWLEALLCVIFLHWLFVTTRATFAFFDLAGGTFLALMDLFSITIFLVFTTVLVVRGLNTVRLFPSLELGRTGFDEEQTRECAARVARTMELERPFLTPSLSIDDLAGMLAVPSWQLSRVINTSFSENFFSFVNGYRIEYAKRELADPANNQKTMLRILHEAGFNSKSTFNDAFRRHTSMTPSEYRQQEQGAVRRAS